VKQDRYANEIEPRAVALKDWQLLMAAVITLAGGTLAYLGAMTEVYFDQGRGRARLRPKETRRLSSGEF
jgi:hypothetical protein